MDSRDAKLGHSFVDGLAQLDIGGQSRGGISKLPNEMLQTILSRVQLPHVIRFRSVNKKWKFVIEDICRVKKTCFVIKLERNDHLLKISNLFNGHIKLSHNFVVIKLKSHQLRYPIYMSANLCPILGKLFPQIEQFFTNVNFSYCSPKLISMLQQWSSTLTTLSLPYLNNDNLYAQINKFPSLQRLNLDSFDGEKIANLLALTLNRLEHFSGSSFGSISKIVQPFLGTRFTSLGLLDPNMTLGEITSWRNVNDQFVSRLERFSFVTTDPRVLPLVCKHFSSLQMLRIDAKIINFVPFKFTTDTIDHLARLTHLTELRFDMFTIDLANFDVANLRSLLNIRSFSLVNFYFATGQHIQYSLPPNFSTQHFVRILYTIFPNLNKLTIKSFLYPEIGVFLEPHVNTIFPNLRSHDFGLYDLIDRSIDN